MLDRGMPQQQPAVKRCARHQHALDSGILDSSMLDDSVLNDSVLNDGVICSSFDDSVLGSGVSAVAVCSRTAWFTAAAQQQCARRQCASWQRTSENGISLWPDRRPARLPCTVATGCVLVRRRAFA